MNSIVKLLRELDAQVPDRVAGTKVAQLGKIAFGDQRGESEKNTEHEDQLLDAIRGFIEDSDSHPLPDWASREIEGYLSRGYYRPVFKKPSKDSIYRGMALSRAFVAEKYRVTDLKPNVPVELKNLVFTPRNATSSWTDSEKMAEEFSKTRCYGDRDVRIVLTASVSGNSGTSFLECSELYGLADLHEESGESEIIAFGPVRVKSATVVLES